MWLNALLDIISSKGHRETSFGYSALQCRTKKRQRKGKDKYHRSLGDGWWGRPAASTWQKDSCCNHLKASPGDFFCSIANTFPMSQQDHLPSVPLCRGNGHLGGQEKVAPFLTWMLLIFCILHGIYKGKRDKITVQWVSKAQLEPWPTPLPTVQAAHWLIRTEAKCGEWFYEWSIITARHAVVPYINCS